MILWNIFIWGFPLFGIILYGKLSKGQQGNNRAIAWICALVSCYCIWCIWDFIIPKHNFWWICLGVIETLFGIANVIGAIGTKD